jgi:hypothetical protein
MDPNTPTTPESTGGSKNTLLTPGSPNEGKGGLA